MSVDELSVMDGSKCILQLRGVRPFFSDKYDLVRHPRYKYLSDAEPKNAFDIGAYVSTRLKVKPDEEYAYFEYIPPDEEMPETPDTAGDFFSPAGSAGFEDYQDYQEDLEPI